MADLITVARPYAEALYGLAKETGQEDAWGKALQTLATVLQDPQAQQFLDDPERTAAAKVEVLSVAEVAVDQEPWRAFLALLIDNDRWPAAGEIAALFAADRRAAMGTVEVLVKSAVALDAGQKDAIEAALSQRFGSRVAFHDEVDPALIGGILVQAGDLTIDASVRGQVEQLARTLRS
jgi:F-type H+-transporting ATPase subunit delta